MGIDPQTDDVMARQPRRLGDRVIDARMWAGVIEVGLAMAVVTLLTIDLYLPGGLIEGSHDLDNARTAGFTTLVFAQLFNCLNARSERLSAFEHAFSNHWLWAAIALSVALQFAVVNVAFLNVAFGTVPLEAGQWLTCAAMASLVVWIVELRKWIARRSATRVPSGTTGPGSC
jgi:P-type Ca2+ transporter type 2C